jgi:hypothetical protein
MELAENAAGPSADRSRVSPRSRVRAGQLLPGVDGRSAWTRRCRDLIAAHITDLGGIDNTSAAERSIVRRAATLTVELERYEAKFALAGEASAADLDLYQRTAGNLRRLLEAVGLQRRAHDVTPTLSEYLAALRQSEAEANKPATEEGGASGMGAAHG